MEDGYIGLRDYLTTMGESPRTLDLVLIDPVTSNRGCVETTLQALSQAGINFLMWYPLIQDFADRLIEKVGLPAYEIGWEKPGLKNMWGCGMIVGGDLVSLMEQRRGTLSKFCYKIGIDLSVR